MPLPSSEYHFPIFISSTDYNLIDLRAELARYLEELGYRPILSSAEGFHDNSPDLEPWESCLEVLETSFVMILIIDNHYGQKMEWKNFKKIIDNRKVSPTHAEYLFAHKTNKRLLVFIRNEILTYYQSYRAAMKKAEKDKAKAKEFLINCLPDKIEFETLEFIEEVKTARPIPWIKGFNTVTEIKQEIQKKMLNELAELFLFRQKRLESVVHAFSSIISEMSEEQRKAIFERIGATKEIIEKIESMTQAVELLTKEKQSFEQQAQDYKNRLQEVSTKEEQRIQLQKKLEETSKELERVKAEITTRKLTSADLISGSTINKYYDPIYHIETYPIKDSLLWSAVGDNWKYKPEILATRYEFDNFTSKFPTVKDSQDGKLSSSSGDMTAKKTAKAKKVKPKVLKKQTKKPPK
jgi:hypothetical protein